MRKKGILVFIFIWVFCFFLKGEEEKPVILVTNDDGIDSLGIKALAGEMTKFGKVLVVAPKNNMSGSSHSQQSKKPTFYSRTDDIPGVDAYWVDNTPVVCVRWAIAGPLKGQIPDLVISGINDGPNIGPSYGSGTVGGAREGALAGAVGIAASLIDMGEKHDYKGAAVVMRKLAQKALNLKKRPLLWNVNFPYGKIDEKRKIKVVEITRRWRKMHYIENKNLDGETYFWFKADRRLWGLEPESDLAYLLKGHITVTPHKVYPVNLEAMDKLRALFSEINERN